MYYLLIVEILKRTQKYKEAKVKLIVDILVYT